jgi:hypothetical protein
MKITKARLKDIIKEEFSMINADAANAEQASLQQGAAIRRLEFGIEDLIDEALDSGLSSQTISEVLQAFAGGVK